LIPPKLVWSILKTRYPSPAVITHKIQFYALWGGECLLFRLIDHLDGRALRTN
jgi:hypothetical protein